MRLSLGPTSSFNWNQQFGNSTRVNKAASVMLALERCAAGADDFFFGFAEAKSFANEGLTWTYK